MTSDIRLLCDFECLPSYIIGQDRKPTGLERTWLLKHRQRLMKQFEHLSFAEMQALQAIDRVLKRR